MKTNSSNEQLYEIEQIKENLKDKEQIIISSNNNQKVKLMRFGNRVYEVIYNYGDLSFENCIVDMFLSK
ncbi:MAG: hypothetical protein ACYDG2_20815 [Ruminiclostridium sp.]